ncbi:hypothetical protein SE16_02280 [Ardenticatena maritima]|nr:hypothetical protein SE16_02280 [Ardenticatena maritima]
MQLQRALLDEPGVLDAGVVMGTDANKEILAQNNLLTEEARSANPEDLVIAIRAESEEAARAALSRVDALLQRRQAQTQSLYRPRSLENALRQLPEAEWVLVSVPGRYAAGVARDALRLNRHVFLYSDNVPLDDEIALKRDAAAKGLLVMGPDCGTAIVNGVGLGFANKVRRGPIGMVAAAGTGLQEVSTRIHRLGGGLTHAFGTGTHDLSAAVGAITTLQALDLLARDPNTRVIVLVSKPPDPVVVEEVLRAARATGKPTVINFIGYNAPRAQDGNLFFTRTLAETAEQAVRLAEETTATVEPPDTAGFAAEQRFLRGLFSGGTLAYEALLLLRGYLPAVYSNAPLDPAYALDDPTTTREHTVLDLGADEFTVGRLHPMIDNDLRIRFLEREAADPAVAVILLDVVLGYGAHPNPAAELAPAVERVRAAAASAGRRLDVGVVVVGTDDDPQKYAEQVAMFEQAGARCFPTNADMVRWAGALVQRLTLHHRIRPVDLARIEKPFAAVNVGIETFYQSMEAQDVPVVWVDWRPPAGGNERLMSILERMKKRPS